MARTNFRGNSTTTLDRQYDDNLLDMIDKKLQTSEPAIKSEMKKFDNSHSVEKLDEVYDDLDLQSLITSSEDGTIPVFDAKSLKKVKVLDTTSHASKQKSIENPFEEAKITKQPTYSEVVSSGNNTPRIEIKSYTPIRPAKASLSKRIKLWLMSGICCLVLLGGVITVSALNLGAIAGSNAGLINQPGVEIGQLSDEAGIINKKGQDLTAEDLAGLDNGTLSPTTAEKIGDSVNTIKNPVASSSIWDKVCAFFAHLFGR